MTYYIHWDHQYNVFDLYREKEPVERNLRLRTGQVIDLLDDWFGENKWDIQKASGSNMYQIVGVNVPPTI